MSEKKYDDGQTAHPTIIYFSAKANNLERYIAGALGISYIRDNRLQNLPGIACPLFMQWKHKILP